MMLLSRLKTRTTQIKKDKSKGSGNPGNSHHVTDVSFRFKQYKLKIIIIWDLSDSFYKTTH